MINPIIYSFTVKEFKRSALRAILPAWVFLHRLCPTLVPKTPDRSVAKFNRNIATKANRSGGEGRRRKPGTLSGNTGSNRQTPNSNRSGIKRRLTEPPPHSAAGGGKKGGEAMASEKWQRRSVIMEEDEGEGGEETVVSAVLVSRLGYTTSESLPPSVPSLHRGSGGGNTASTSSTSPCVVDYGYSSSSEIDEDEIIRMPCRVKRNSLPGGSGGIGRFLPYMFQDRRPKVFEGWGSGCGSGEKANGFLHGYANNAVSWIRRSSQRGRGLDANNNSGVEGEGGVKYDGGRRRKSEGNAIMTLQKKRSIEAIEAMGYTSRQRVLGGARREVGVRGGLNGRAAHSTRKSSESTTPGPTPSYRARLQDTKRRSCGEANRIPVLAQAVSVTINAPSESQSALPSQPQAQILPRDLSQCSIRVYCLTTETIL